MRRARSVPGWLAAAAWGLSCAVPAVAHDFWIEPASFTPAVGQLVAVRLLVGEDHRGDAVARPGAGSMNRFVAGETGSLVYTTLPGLTGADPAGYFRAAAAGAYVIGFHGKPIEIELPADKFNAYLKAEGLEAVLERRVEQGQMDQPGREIYSRCAKSLLLSGPAQGERKPADQALGCPFELIAERDPRQLRKGESLPVRVLFQQRALAGVLVVAMPRAASHDKVSLRSDGQGRVLLPLDRGGPWLVKAVHMVAAPANSGADWESFWASVTLVSGAGAEGDPASGGRGLGLGLGL